MIDRRIQSRHLNVIHRGVYAVGHRRVNQRGHWLAAVLACGEGAVLSHLSAAALWGLASQRGPVDVTGSGHPGRTGIGLHRAHIHPEERAVRDRIPVTSVARTLFDYAETVDFGRLEKAWEEADRLNLLQLAAVERVCERGHGRHALRPTRRLLAEARAPYTKRSPLENRFAAFCRAHRIPPPATNVDVLGHEVDALWPQARLVIELDSWKHHSHRAAFERDRTRDPKLLLAGYRTVRVTSRRLDKEAAELAAEIHELLKEEHSSRAALASP